MRNALALPTLLVPALVLALAAGPALAEEGLRIPSWSGEDVLLREAGLPEGWTRVGGAEALAAAEALEAPVKALLEKEGVDELDVTQCVVALRNAGGEVVTLSFVDVDAEPRGVPAGLEALAKEKGWTHRALGTPMRHLLASGPEAARAAALAAQVRYGAMALTESALQRAGQVEETTVEGSRQAAVESARSLANAALALEPKAAAPHAVLGLLLALEAQTLERKDAWQAAADEFRKAFVADAVLPPPPALAFVALSEFGGALLSLKSPEGTREARDLLVKALALGEKAPAGPRRGTTRYNLACARSLLGEKAEAVRDLAEALKELKGTWPAARFQQFVQHHIPADKDLDNIRNEPGFQEAVAGAGGGDSEAGGI